MSTLDQHILAQLERDIGSDGLAVLLDTFKDEVRKRPGAIANHIYDEDFEAARIDSHALKAAATSIGAKRLGEVCFRIEKLCQAGKIAGLDLAVSEMMREARLVLEDLV